MQCTVYKYAMSDSVCTVNKYAMYVCLDLKGAFVEEPMDGWVVKGGRASLACTPPPGHPAPRVTWAKDGKPVNTHLHPR
jgi:hypothetical protein